MFGSRKEKIQLVEYIYHTASDIVNMEKLTYEMYLRNDSERILSKEDFAHYSNNELNIRLCLLDGFLNDKMLNRKLKVDQYGYGFALGKGIVMALGNNGYDKNSISIIMEYLEKDFDGYKDYLIKEASTFPKTMPTMNYVLFYFSAAILRSLEGFVEKSFSLGGLLKANELMLSKYLESSFRRVKIIN